MANANLFQQAFFGLYTKGASPTVLASGTINFYDPGTTTDKNTYTDETKDTTEANPVTLDSDGRFSTWLDGNYKIVVKNSAGTTIYTMDPANFLADVTLGGTFSSVIGLPDGSVTAPASSFSNDTNTGLYRIGSGNVGFTADGVKIFEYDGTNVTYVKPALLADGVLANPGISFSSDDNTGFFRVGSGHIAFSSNATRIVDFLSTDIRMPMVRHGHTSNLGLELSSGVLSITDAVGTALSSTNRGYVALPRKGTSGQIISFPIQGNQSFIDDAGSSEILNNLFGATTGVAWAEDVPFYIYAVSNNAENTIAFMISRVPHMTTSPVVGEIGAPDDAVADNSFSFFSFENIDETLYDANPCICIGSFKMRMSASDDWTVQTLGNGDGIGLFQEGVVFTMPLAQNGAAAGTFFQDNSGTAPIFITNIYEYTINKTGSVTIFLNIDGDGGTDGSGSVNTQIALPLLSSNMASAYHNSIVKVNSATGGNRALMASIPDNGNYFLIYETDETVVQNADFGNGGRRIRLTLTYLSGIA